MEKTACLPAGRNTFGVTKITFGVIKITFGVFENTFGVFGTVPAGRKSRELIQMINRVNSNDEMN